MTPDMLVALQAGGNKAVNQLMTGEPAPPASAPAVVAVPAVDAAPATGGSGAEEVVAAVTAAAAEGQQALAAGVDQQLGTLAAVVAEQLAGIDAGTTAQLAGVDGAFAAAHDRIGLAVLVAQQRLAQAGAAEQQRLTVWAAQAQQQLAAGADVRAARVEATGATRGGDAVQAATGAATGTETQGAVLAAQARTAGAARAAAETDASRAGTDVEASEARAAAAREIAGDTADRVVGSLGDTVGQLRGLGPETQAELVAAADRIAARIRAQLPTVAAVLGHTTTGAGAHLNQAVTNGTAALAGFGAESTGQLALLHSSVTGAVRQQAEEARQAVREAGGHAIDAGRAQHGQAAAAASATVDAVLAGVANRRLRRAAAARLAADLGAQVKQGFGDAGQAARVAVAGVARLLGDTADQVLDAVRAGAVTGSRLADGAAAAGEAGAAGRADELTAGFAGLVAAAIGSGDGVVAADAARLDQLVADLDIRFGRALTDFRQTLTDRSGEALDRARDPVTTLDGRMTVAMREAAEATRRSWLENAVREVPWGMIAGVVVGLVVTVATIALIGTGVGALILAGALSGAMSALATTLTDDAVRGHDTSWSELGVQMAAGTAFGAVGGALGAGLTGAAMGAVRREVLTEAGAVAVGKAAGVVSGVTLGVVNNVVAGRPWHEGILVNIGLSLALTYGPGGRFVDEVTAKAAGDTARAAGPDLPADVRSPRGGPDADGFVEAVLPAGTVMHGEPALTEAVARQMFATTRKDSPYREVAIMQHSETGEYVVIQGDTRSVEIGTGSNSALRELTAEGRDGGYWMLVEHSHPVTPGLGVTELNGRFPSGYPGDFAVARVEAEQGGRAVEQRLTYSTVRGDETAYYGYDPGAPEPYWLRFPEPDGSWTTARFENMLEYHVWFRSQPGLSRFSPNGRATVAELSRAPDGDGAGSPSPPPGGDLLELPEGTVMFGDPQLSEQEARLMYANARRDDPGREVGLYRNGRTGEFIAVQGARNRVGISDSNASMREYMQTDWRSRTHGWRLVEHSHPVDAGTGFTHPSNRFPSGRGGDFTLVENEAVATRKWCEHRVGIVTERGDEVVLYSYDPAEPARPYAMTYPDPGGRPLTVRFGSMEEYGSWYSKQPGVGGRSPHIAGGRPPPRP